MEEQSLFQMSTGSTSLLQKINAAKMLQSSVPTFLCPTRRTGGVSPYLGSVPLKNCAPVETAAKNDFAINQAVGGLKSEWTLLDVRDGLTQTILYGEKLLRGSTPSGAGDEDAMLVGMDDDNHRSTTYQLGRDKVIDLAYATLLVACFMAFAAYRGTTRPGMDWLWPTMNDHLGG